MTDHNLTSAAKRMDAEWLASERARREAAMPVMTPLIKEVLGLAKVIREDGGIALVQGDSGLGKTEAVKAITLKQDGVVVFTACTARARMKPMLADIAISLAVNASFFEVADMYRAVADGMKIGRRMGRSHLLVVDEVHKYIGRPDCLQVLADLVKGTDVPQLWIATGDMRRYLDRKVGSYKDPFAQIRSRITHQLNLNELRDSDDGMVGPDDVRELAERKLGVKLDGGAVRVLLNLARLDNEGGLRLVANVLKHARRVAAARKQDRIDADAIRFSIDRTVFARTRGRARRAEATAVPPPPVPLPVEQPGRRSMAG